MNSLAERADIRAQFDLRRNYFALYLCLVGKGYKTVKSALNAAYGTIEDPDKEKEAPSRSAYWTDEKLDKIEKLRSQGMTWYQVGEALNTTAGAAITAYRKYRRANK